jgi:D-inositol-3-phosphate glycosyltransferase
VRGLHLDNRVQFVGRVDRAALPQLLRSAIAAVCLPWYEPFGIVPLEAMACGVPVVGSAVGGLLDTFIDGTTGLLVPPRDPRSAAQAVQRLLDRPRWRHRLGRAARRHAQRYSWTNAARGTEATYLRARTAPRQRSPYEEVLHT